jgi:hypothetical protein
MGSRSLPTDGGDGQVVPALEALAFLRVVRRPLADVVLAEQVCKSFVDVVIELRRLAAGRWLMGCRFLEGHFRGFSAGG